MNLEQRYKTLEKEGHYIASRVNRGMEVYLYKVNDFYAEAWKRYMSNAITWIEIVPEDFLTKYTGAVDLKQLFENTGN